MNAEGGFKEFKTRSIVESYLTDLGLCDTQKLAQTGIVVDIHGTGEETATPMNIAFRSELDALPMSENNDFDYKSQTDHAHMCGHDGHMTILLTFIRALL